MCLRAQYTFILLASKKLPKTCVDYLTGKVKTRRSVGVRMPDHPLTQVGPLAVH
jgi:tRNA A37 threonylcarbamoyladenosine synthetase subunit TsaC/SUA5/YrdC